MLNTQYAFYDLLRKWSNVLDAKVIDPVRLQFRLAQYPETEVCFFFNGTTLVSISTKDDPAACILSQVGFLGESDNSKEALQQGFPSLMFWVEMQIAQYWADRENNPITLTIRKAFTAAVLSQVQTGGLEVRDLQAQLNQKNPARFRWDTTVIMGVLRRSYEYRLMVPDLNTHKTHYYAMSLTDEMFQQLRSQATRN